MGKLKKLNSFSLFIILIFGGFSAHSQRINTDYQSIAMVNVNLGMQEAVELDHNIQLDSIKRKQEEILSKGTAIMTYKLLYVQSMQNVKGFGTESMFYKEIATTATKIADLSVQVIEAIPKSSMLNKANAILAVTDLSMKCVNCVNDFVNIVTNSTVANPLEEASRRKQHLFGRGQKDDPLNQLSKRKDGANLLDRYERMKLAGQIVVDLKAIKNQLNRLLFLCKYGDWSSLIGRIDRKTWVTIYNGQSQSQRLINKWNTLINKK